TLCCDVLLFFFFSSRRRHTRLQGDWSSDVCSSDLWPVGSTQSARRFCWQRLLRQESCSQLISRSHSSTSVWRSLWEVASPLCDRSEERRVGKECRSRWWA